MNNRVCNELPVAFYSCDYLTSSLILSMSTVKGRQRSSETQTDTHTYFDTHARLHMNRRHTNVFRQKSKQHRGSRSRREVWYRLEHNKWCGQAVFEALDEPSMAPDDL